MSGRRPVAYAGTPLALLRLAIFGSQVRLAQALTARGLPTTRQAVSRWEREEAIPSEERIALLCVLLSLRPEQIEALLWPHILDDLEEGDPRRQVAALVAAAGRSLDGRCPLPVAAGRAVEGAPAHFGGRP